MKPHTPPVLYSVDLSDCAAIGQLTTGEISETFAAALEAAGATILQAASHTFPGAGLTCVLILSESHAVLHTWPETGTVNLDIFSCSTRLKSLEAIAELRRLSARNRITVQEIPRADGHGPAARTAARKFALRAVAWSLGLFGLLRLNWTEAHAVLPFTRVQAALAAGLFGASALPVEVTLACSGADALALCLGAILAYPVAWRSRLAGAAGGAALILGLNTLRIGTLGRAAASPVWFNTLHVYVWPAVLTLAIAGYVFAWMRLADRRRTPDHNARRSRANRCSAARPQPSRRFILFTAAFLLLFTAASPLYLESTGVLALAGFIARAAAATLGLVGVSAHAAANVLWTPRGGFLVTQECISTPLIPVYLAAVCAYSPTWRRLTLGVLATLPLFTALGIVRLLVVALPDALVASPLFLVHAFYQLLLGAVVVFVAALWRHGGRAALGYAAAGVIVGVLFASLLGPCVHARRDVSGRRAARRSAGGDRLPPHVPGRPVSRALGRGLRRGRLEALPGRARGARAHADGRPARAAGRRQPLRPHGAGPRRPRLGRGGPRADFRRGDQRCAGASLKPSRSRLWPRSSPWRSRHPCFARRRNGCSGWRSSGATTIRSP